MAANARLIRIGDVTALIETDDRAHAPEFRGVEELSARGADDSIATTAYKSFLNLVETMSRDISSSMNSIRDAASPTKLEVEIGLTLTVESDLWVIKGASDSTVKLTLGWEKIGNER